MSTLSIGSLAQGRGWLSDTPAFRVRGAASPLSAVPGAIGSVALIDASVYQAVLIRFSTRLRWLMMVSERGAILS